MPLPNGVDPFGEIQPTCPSASFLGNRGILHKDTGEITRRWQNTAWRTCALHFKGRNIKPFMQPGGYTELFFLDEATALSAGHRPCGECRKEDYEKFKSAWNAAKGTDASIKEIDRQLHAERLISSKDGKPAQQRLDELPDGVMFAINDQAFLKWKDDVLAWSPTGYSLPRVEVSKKQVVSVLTPASIIDVIRKGYQVRVHETATKLSV